jgi:parvulin-like peptidyl-prolyl isomerase
MYFSIDSAGEPDAWSDPFRSGYGRHLILVEDRTDESLPPLAELPDRI